MSESWNSRNSANGAGDIPCTKKPKNNFLGV